MELNESSRYESSMNQFINSDTPPLLVKGSRDPSVRSKGLPAVVVAL